LRGSFFGGHQRLWILFFAHNHMTDDIFINSELTVELLDDVTGTFELVEMIEALTLVVDFVGQLSKLVRTITAHSYFFTDCYLPLDI
jgi:hypothetical protein